MYVPKWLRPQMAYNLSDSEALERIIIKLNKYTVTTEGGIGEQKQN